MPRFLRVYLLGCIAITFAYLLLHVREPLRLNLGDPGADAGVLSSIKYIEQHGFFARSFIDDADAAPLTADAVHPIGDPPLAEILYGAIGKYLGVGDIGTLRLFALACSALAMLLLFQYSRRIWNDTVALLATALFTTSLLWMMYADSIHQAPLLQASGFLALWGLVRAIETRRRRYYAAAFLGACACYLASYDYWLFLPAAALFTISRKLGNPFAHGNRRFVMVCAAGCLAGVLVKALFVTGVVEGQELVSLDRKLGSTLPTLLRRYSIVFTPMVWVTVGYTAWRALRAPSLRSVLEDGVTWMLVTAAISMYVLSQPAASRMLDAQPLLPFYAIGSAVLIQRLLDGSEARRALAIAWVGLAPAWACLFMLTHPRSVLARGDVAEVNAYLAANDRNDFVLSNLMSDGPIQAVFDRHNWALEAADLQGGPVAPGIAARLDAQHRPFASRPLAAELDAAGKLDARFAIEARMKMLEVLEATGADYVHAVIFTTPESRFIDRALWRLGAHRRQWSVTGWPYLYRSKGDKFIREYDQLVLKNLQAVDAKQVLHLKHFDVYRVERAVLLEAAGREVQVVRRLDFGSIESNKHKLLGWGDPRFSKDEGIAITSLVGHDPCPNPAPARRAGEPGGNACKTAPTGLGIKVVDEAWADRAQVMIRVERACDLRVVLELASPALLRLSMNDFTASQCIPERQTSFLIPRRSVRPGINFITFEKRFGPEELRADVASLAIDPVCESD